MLIGRREGRCYKKHDNEPVVDVGKLALKYPLPDISHLQEFVQFSIKELYTLINMIGMQSDNVVPLLVAL